MVVSLLYSRRCCFLIFTTAGIKCVVRERHMRPAGQIGSHALSLNQSTTSSFVFLVFVFVFVSQTIHHHPLCFVFALVSCPVSQLMHQSTTSDFVFLVFVFVSIPVSRIPINPPPAALFISVFGFQYLPVSQSSTNIYHRCQKKKRIFMELAL